MQITLYIHMYSGRKEVKPLNSTSISLLDPALKLLSELKIYSRDIRSSSMSQDSWSCQSCCSPIVVVSSSSRSRNNNSHVEEPKSLGELQQERQEDDSGMARVKCTSCDKSVAVSHRPGGHYLPIQTVLKDSRKTTNGCFAVQTESDRLALFTLCQIIYKEWESPEEDLLEFEFDLPPTTDLVKIVWIDGEAVGYYSVKPKGTLDMETLQTYAMPTLDTIFIRKSYRRQGLASWAVQDFSMTFPQLDIGFSYPISLAMFKVLGKHLEERAEDRPRFWEITGCGREGNCRNLWLILQRQRRKEVAL